MIEVRLSVIDVRLSANEELRSRNEGRLSPEICGVLETRRGEKEEGGAVIVIDLLTLFLRGSFDVTPMSRGRDVPFFTSRIAARMLRRSSYDSAMSS